MSFLCCQNGEGLYRKVNESTWTLLLTYFMQDALLILGDITLITSLNAGPHQLFFLLKNIMSYSIIFSISNENSEIKDGVLQKKKFNKNQHKGREKLLYHPISTVRMCIIKKKISFL